MEDLMLPAFNPHLKRVLKDFQSAAVRSLSGPSNYAPAWIEGADLNEYRKALLLTGGLKKEAAAVGDNKLSGQTPSREGEPFFTPPPLPIQQMPLFMPMDASKSEKADTILEGETIACFIVGGEKRLCLPQILNTVLREIELPQINAVCDELHIFCSRCNSDQLNILKMSGVLPWSAPSCGLITKTDSERLCNALLHSSLERSREPPSRNSFKVYHECFGKCKGIFGPELYTNPHAKCIECFDCHGMFSPQKFVCHSHKALENRTCHWGFDSANWRSYLLIAKDQEGKDRAQNVLDLMKAKFDLTSCYKRKESPCEDRESVDGKKPRYEETAALLSDHLIHVRQMSAFQPWAPMKVLAKMVETRESMSEALPSNLHTGRPILLNPERVVPHSESHRYERHFAPNVSLAPAPYQKAKVSEFDKENVASLEGESDKRPRTPSSVTRSTPLSTDEPFNNLSSDTEESLKSEPETVLSPRSDHRVAASSVREREVRLMREVLSERPEEAEAKERLLREFLQLRCADDEKLADLVKENKYLRQELETAKAEQREKLREASDSKKLLYKEMKELVEQVQLLRIEVDTARKSRSLDVAKTKAKYKGQVMQLKAELHQYKYLLQQQQEQQQQQRQLGCQPSPHKEGVKSPVESTLKEQLQEKSPSDHVGECAQEGKTGKAVGHQEEVTVDSDV